MALKKFTLVSNRGPRFVANSKIHMAAGGTQDAYAKLCAEICKRWICVVPDEFNADQVISAHEELDILPVQNETYDKYYYQYVSEHLYPSILAHAGSPESATAISEFSEVSRQIACKVGAESSVILCDYHLYEVPLHLQGEKEVYFFWFLPFLDDEISRDVKLQIARGLLQVDVLWFLHEDYKNNFLNFVNREFPLSKVPEIETLTLGPSDFFAKTEQIQLQDFKDELLSRFGVTYDDESVYLLTVARLDFVKNIPLLLDAIRIVGPQHKQIKMLIIAPHHRKGSQLYLKEERLIRSKVAALEHLEMVYLSDEPADFETLRILYKYTDVFILPSTHDAMPLTPLEYALANKGDGAIIVSDSAGTSKILSSHVQLFANQSHGSLAYTISQTLEMNRLTRVQRMRNVKEKIRSLTSSEWIKKVKNYINGFVKEDTVPEEIGIET